ncbi:MAG TPA: LysR family transcriptional regulator [Hyphomicrobiales bacterium]|nr:LysR family transcriptional regulator [Hyphomicrobiales bacterium]
MLHATFRQLEVFVAVVDAGSFAAGAARLEITQPSVSNHVRALEAEAGCLLLERRRGTRATLTEHGRRLYREATALLAQAEAIAAGLPRSRDGMATREIGVIAQHYIMERWIQPRLPEFLRRYPAVTPVIRSGSYEDVVRALKEGEADLGYFVSDGPPADIASRKLRAEPGGLFVAPSHPLAGRHRLAAAEIARHPFILPVRGSQFGGIVTRTLASIGIAGYPVAFQAHYGEIVKDMAVRGRGIACLFVGDAEALVEAGQLVRLDVAVPDLDIREAFGVRRPLDPAVERFAALVRSALGPALAA